MNSDAKRARNARKRAKLKANRRAKGLSARASTRKTSRPVINPGINPELIGIGKDVHFFQKYLTAKYGRENLQYDEYKIMHPKVTRYGPWIEVDYRGGKGADQRVSFSCPSKQRFRTFDFSKGLEDESNAGKTGNDRQAEKLARKETICLEETEEEAKGT